MTNVMLLLIKSALTCWRSFHLFCIPFFCFPFFFFDGLIKQCLLYTKQFRCTSLVAFRFSVTNFVMPSSLWEDWMLSSLKMRVRAVPYLLPSVASCYSFIHLKSDHHNSPHGSRRCFKEEMTFYKRFACLLFFFYYCFIGEKVFISDILSLFF